jgi:hypothetical protein
VISYKKYNRELTFENFADGTCRYSLAHTQDTTLTPLQLPGTPAKANGVTQAAAQKSSVNSQADGHGALSTLRIQLAHSPSVQRRSTPRREGGEGAGAVEVSAGWGLRLSASNDLVTTQSDLIFTRRTSTAPPLSPLPPRDASSRHNLLRTEIGTW